MGIRWRRRCLPNFDALNDISDFAASETKVTDSFDELQFIEVFVEIVYGPETDSVVFSLE